MSHPCALQDNSTQSNSSSHLTITCGHSICTAATRLAIPCIFRQKQHTTKRFTPCSTAHKSIHALHHHDNIPVSNNECKQFVSAQIHRNHGKQHLNIHTVKQVQQKLPKGIIHWEDPSPNKLMWYCPTLYHQAITNTFTDPEVFTISASPPLAHDFHVYNACNSITELLPTYSWVFKEWGHIPPSYILPNSKKKYSKGKPIVAFLSTMGRTLWEALADVLQLMTNQACPHAFRQRDAVTQLTQTAQVLQSKHKDNDDNTYVWYNQDLAGFSTSVDNQRFLAAHYIMARWYQDKNWTHAPLPHSTLIFRKRIASTEHIGARASRADKNNTPQQHHHCRHPTPTSRHRHTSFMQLLPGAHQPHTEVCVPHSHAHGAICAMHRLHVAAG